MKIEPGWVTDFENPYNTARKAVVKLEKLEEEEKIQDDEKEMIEDFRMWNVEHFLNQE